MPPVVPAGADAAMAQDDAERLDKLEARLRTYLSDSGRNQSARRSVVLRALVAGPKHATVAAVVGLVRQGDARIGASTVYRTLQMMVEAGVVIERDFGRAALFYEIVDDLDQVDHAHLLCTECEDIIEFVATTVSALEIAVATEFGFVLRSHRFEILGVCSPCQRRLRRRGRSRTRSTI